MEMPTPCNNCGNIFDLNDGCRSPRNPKIVICSSCADIKDDEIEREEEIEELKNEIADAQHTIALNTARLKELKAE